MNVSLNIILNRILLNKILISMFRLFMSHIYRVATVMEKSWNFWNFEIFWNFWKSHGIWTKIANGHGKVMEF